MGNFSKEPKDVLDVALKKDYESLLIQQGVPVLDRDLNLLSDLAHNWIRELSKKHIGNGVPAGSDGFRIYDVVYDNQDFKIAEGTILVNGHFVSFKGPNDNEPYVTYKNQPIPIVGQGWPDLPFGVYLRVWEEEIGPTDDPALNNDEDVGMPTSVRRKTFWQVVVGPVIGPHSDETLILLATINAHIGPLHTPPRVDDKRIKNLTLQILAQEIHVKGGDVGIGITNPESKLHVDGDLRIDRNLYLKGNSGTYQKVLRLDTNNDVTLWNPIGGEDDDIFLGTGTIDGQHIRMTVKGNGKLGIGTTDPRFGRVMIEDAHVPLALRETGVAVDQGGLWRMPLDGGKLRFDVNTGTQGNEFGSNYRTILAMTKDGDVSMGRNLRMNDSLRSLHVEKDGAQDNYLHINAGGDHPGVRVNQNKARPFDVNNGQLHVKADGKVGIGTASPDNKLSVEGDGYFRTSIRTHVNATNSPGSLEIGFSRGTGSSPSAVLHNDSIGSLKFAGFNGQSYAVGTWIRAKAREDFTPSAAGSDLEFYTRPVGTNLNMLRMTISQNGCVGIGNMIPYYTLHTNGTSYAVTRAGGGIDYAEYLESLNGKEIPAGTAVVFEKGKVRKVKKGEVPIGVISANPIIVGGVYPEWPKKYLRDEFGNLTLEKYEEEVMVPKKEKVTRERQKMKKKKITEEVTRTDIVVKKGKHCQKEIKEKVISEVEEPVFKEVDLYDTAGKKKIGKHKIPAMETYDEEVEVFDENGQPVLVGSGKFETKKRPKLNPKYNEAKKYIPRENRSEWNCVGLLGQIPLRKGQPVADGWIKVKDISDDVELWLVK